jgi:hypothetical protein
VAFSASLPRTSQPKLVAGWSSHPCTRATISADYLDGKIDRETAIRLVQKYQLVSRARAEQLIKFTDEYRSYVINYGLGQDEVKAHVERAGKAQAARWAAFEALIGEPTIPADFVGR